MTNTPVKYCAGPSPGTHSDIHEVSGDRLSEATEHTVAAAQTHWTYFLLGCATLLPFNALFNAMSFFLSRLAGSSYYPTFSSYLSSTYSWIKLVCQFYCTFTLKRSSPSRRIFASIIMMILLVTSLCSSTFIRGIPSAFFTFTLLNAAFMAVAASYLSTAVFARAALLGTSCLQSVLSGQAVFTVLVSAVQVASAVIALWGSSPKSVSMEAATAGDRDDQAEEIAARIFFGVVAVFLCIVLVAYTWLTRQPFYKSVIDTLERHRRGVGSPDERTGLLVDDRRDPLAGSTSHVYQIFGKNLIFMFSITYVFTVTLAVYPTITVRVRPTSLGIHPLLFTALHFLVINTGGFLGQHSCSYPRFVIWSAKKILGMSLLRTLFIPLILLCNIDRPTTTSGPSIIQSDILFMIIMLATGYTNGYVYTLALLAVSSLEHNPRLKGRREDVDIAATLGSSCMILGLALGSLCSFGVQAMI